MKKILLALVFLAFATPALADVWIKGHYNEEGDWVPGYWKTTPNGTDEDNYSYGSNYNPHNGYIGGRPQTNTPLNDYPQYKSYGQDPFPSSNRNNDGGSNKIEMPKLNSPINKDGCKRTSIYEPACP